MVLPRDTTGHKPPSWPWRPEKASPESEARDDLRAKGRMVSTPDEPEPAPLSDSEAVAQCLAEVRALAAEVRELVAEIRADKQARLNTPF